MVSEARFTQNGVGFVSFDYSGGADPAQEISSFEKKAEEMQRELGVNDIKFNLVSGRPEDVVSRYGRCNVLLEYLEDNYASFVCGNITRASSFDRGSDALRFCEGYVNSLGTFAGTPIRPYQSLERIPFYVGFNEHEPVAANLFTGVEQSQLLVRARCNIYVVEVASPKTG